MTINTRKIFLASSSELKEDRKEFEIFISRRNKAWVSQGVYLELVQWEDFMDALSQTRLQDEYNKAIKDCDLFVMLFFTKVGQYTAEEFETAFGQFKATNKPFIFTYFKDGDISTGNANKKDLMSLWAFQEKLDDLGHFYTRYKNIDELKLHFSQQLDKLAANGFIELLKNENGISIKQAELTGSGSIAQGEGDAMGAGAVKVTGDVVGNIISGTQIINHYHGVSGGLGKEDIARQVAGYLLWLRERTSSIELRGIEKAGGAPVVQLPLATGVIKSDAPLAKFLLCRLFFDATPIVVIFPGRTGKPQRQHGFDSRWRPPCAGQLEPFLDHITVCALDFARANRQPLF